MGARASPSGPLRRGSAETAADAAPALVGVKRKIASGMRAMRELLAVYHDLDDEHREHMKSRGVDPADYLGADDLGGMLGDGFTREVHAVESRIDPPPDTPHIADLVLRARRR